MLISLIILTCITATLEFTAILFIKLIINFIQGVELQFPFYFYCIGYLLIKFISIITERQNQFLQVNKNN